MRPNSYPESYDTDSNLERNIEVFKKFHSMLLLVHIDMQTMIIVRHQALQNTHAESSVQAEGILYMMRHTTLIKDYIYKVHESCCATKK